MLKHTVLLAALISIIFVNRAFCEEGLRRSPVSYHMSFDNRDFFEEDFIEVSGKKSVEDRKIDFPDGRFGKGLRMSFIPEPPDADNMTGIDLDLITAVIFNTSPNNKMGYNQPFIWGSGRCNPRFGAVAFWAKGKPPYVSPLFEQTTIAFGRLERDLLGVMVDDTNRISAYVRDARYVRHELKTDVVWDSNRWNHVVLNWDWANGQELWLNGEKIASSWGTDGWFETLPPGLFHLPTPGMIYDEVYLFDRPVSDKEIRNLMKTNTIPKPETAKYERKKYDEKRIALMSGADRGENLPVVVPGAGLKLTEVWPCDAADGCVPGWYVIDGRNEMAWPHEYAFFTIIPGDADFHAEKVDITMPPGKPVNYVALTGNLSNVKIQDCTCPDKTEDLFSVPGGDRFFYGSTITSTEGATFRIPFTESYGSPAGFQGDVVHLPLSGEKRVHNVGFYLTSPAAKNISGERYQISIADENLDSRYSFAVHALTSRDERTIALASDSSGRNNTINIGAFQRLHIMSEPYNSPTGIAEITLMLPVQTEKSEEVLFIRVHDPAVPSRLWNQFAINLKDFNKGFNNLTLTVDFRDIVVTGGDRLWIDVGTAGFCKIKLGDRKTPAELVVSTALPYVSVDEYAEKEIISSKAQYSKMYEFMPWQFTGREVTLEKPYCYGGPFDILLPALAIKRVKPDHFVSNFMIRMSGPEFKDGHRIDKSTAPLITLTDPDGAPDWAVYMRDFNTKRHAIADWWVKRQNPDGQMGGGWNDDTLFMSFHQPDLPLDGNENARAIIDTVHTKFEKTGLFKDGYCRIYPIDRMHTGDFISERYNTFVNNLGQAHAAEREMESAWRLGHPDETPVNYAQGIAFRSSVNIFNWYWGKDVPEVPYISKPLDELTTEFRLYASLFDDYRWYRLTESNVHRDDYIPHGAFQMYVYMLGGEHGARWDAHMKLAVMWPSGGGPDVARIIKRADDTSIEVICYSFDDEKRDLKMRMCRIEDGIYRVGMYADPTGRGNAGSAIWQTEQNLRRFDVVSLPIPPKTPLVIKVEQIEAHNRPEKLPDLVIDPWEATIQGSTVTAMIHNLGNGAADNIVVRLLDGEKTVQEKIIRLDAPVDFTAQRTTVTFSNVIRSRNLKVVIDPDNTIQEILEENNRAFVR
ncbi:MAG: hypothetical protein JXB48_22195 [Candidatus Latescibacteria bacterium]|nr:hypothetical protein [Candidatus Latescibacterota bacterium]